jgi:hypothetical protein
MQGRRELKPPRELAIDPALLAEFAALPPSGIGTMGRAWTGPEDELLLMFWPNRDKKLLSKKIGCNESTARAHYRRLVAADPGRAARLAEEGKRLCG